MTMKELEAKLGRKPSVNEWLIANGRKPLAKQGRKIRANGLADKLNAFFK